MRLSRPGAADILAAAGAIALGAFAVWEASSYAMGTPRNMGPGYFPRALGIVLILGGIAILLEGMLASSRLTERVNLRGVLAIGAALGAFLLLLPRFGLIPTIFASVILAGLAERDPRPLGLIVLAVFLAVMCYFVFIWGLQMRIRPFIW